MSHTTPEVAMRTCRICKVEKTIVDFCWRSDAMTYRHRCLECERKRNKDKYNKNKSYFQKRDSVLTDKRKARNKVKDAIKRGIIKRQPCEVCKEEKTDAHHDDYSKPLEVRFLCKRHHAEVHRATPTKTDKQTEV